MMVQQSGIREAGPLSVTATFTVMLSVIAHGLSAVPDINAMFGKPASETSGG